MTGALTTEAVAEQVVREEYYMFPGTMLTVACITLANGFTISGESTCAEANAANFSATAGERYALQDALGKAIPYFAFLERELNK